jgi:hypothetical protein
VEQETFIAELLAVDETWELLAGPGEANNHYLNKNAVRGEIATKVNAQFSTEEYMYPLQLDAHQIKNKIDSMKKQWKKANNTRKSTGNGDEPNDTLEQKILRICHFYYILENLWS